MKDKHANVKLIVIVLAVLKLSVVFADSKIDSLLQVLDDGKANADTYNELAYTHWYVDLKKSQLFAQKAYQLSLAENDSNQLSLACNRLGTTCIYNGKLDSALIWYKQHATIAKQIKDYNMYAGAIACCARTLYFQTEYEQALVEYKNAIKIFETLEVSEYYVQTLLTTGQLYWKIGKYSDAEPYYTAVIEHISALNITDQIAAYNQVAMNYQQMNNFSKALFYFNKAIEKCDLNEHSLALSSCYINTANFYLEWGKNKEALTYLETGFNIADSVGYQTYCRTILTLKGDIYFELKNYDKAKDAYSHFFDYSMNSPDPINQGTAYQGLGKVSLVEEDYEAAIRFFNKSLSLFEHAGNAEYLLEIHYVLAAAYLEMSKPAKAKIHIDKALSALKANPQVSKDIDLSLAQARYHTRVRNLTQSSAFYEEYILMNDSLFNQKNQNLIARYQVEMGNMEKDHQIAEAESLNKIIQVKLTQRKRQLMYITSISLLLTLVLLSLAYFAKRLKASNKILFLKNKTLLEQDDLLRKQRSKRNISESITESIAIKLEIEMNSNKIFKQSELTLSSLAKVLNTNTSYLSQVVKSEYDSSFSIYLNKCRIQEAQRMILDSQYLNYTIEAISRECGYNSKSTFNKAFKDIVGLTPNIYRKQKPE